MDQPAMSQDALSQPRPRRVLVTGASRGIGAAVAQGFAALGDRVALHYVRDEMAAHRVLDSMPGDGHVLVRGDLADPDAVRSFVDDAATRLGGLDILVNNAGIFDYHPVLTTSYDRWQESFRSVMDVNLFGVANTIWCALRHLPTTGGGRIISIGSRGAFRGEPKAPAYGASKAALTSLTQSLAKDLGPQRIAVSMVAPGFTETDMAREELDGPNGDGRRNESTWGRVATPAEVAAAVVYLASAEAEFATGTVIDINGASYLRM